MVGEFHQWCAVAKASERREAAGLLVETLLGAPEACHEHRFCLDALLILATDPSPTVRAIIAERLIGARNAPRRLVLLLCQDIDSIAVPLVSATAVLGDEDLVELALSGSPRLRCALARRDRVCASLAAALATCGERVVVLELLSNREAQITASTLRALYGRFGADDPCVRDLMLRRQALPADVRRQLLLRTSDVLAGMDLVRGVLGEGAARRIASQACENGVSIIAENLDGAAADEFLNHLRAEGEVTPALLARAACAGRIEFFAAALSSLSGLGFARVRAILVDAREPAFSALCAAARLPHELRPLLLSAIRLWRDHARAGEAMDGEARIAILDRLARQVRAGDIPAADPLPDLLARLSADAVRDAARPARLAA